MVTMARVGPGQSQEAGASARSPVWMQGSRHWTVLCYFARPLAGSWIGNREQLGCGVIPIWHAGVTGHGLTPQCFVGLS